jgi:hypothetical protein
MPPRARPVASSPGAPVRDRRGPRESAAVAPCGCGADHRERLCPSVLAAMQDRRTADGFAFGVLLNEEGAGRLEPTKA